MKWCHFYHLATPGVIDSKELFETVSKSITMTRFLYLFNKILPDFLNQKTPAIMDPPLFNSLWYQPWTHCPFCYRSPVWMWIQTHTHLSYKLLEHSSALQATLQAWNYMAGMASVAPCLDFGLGALQQKFPVDLIISQWPIEVTNCEDEQHQSMYKSA